MTGMDMINVDMQQICVQYGAAYFDPRPVIGQFRPGGPAGNLWDIRTEYDGDGIHHSAAGRYALANAIYRLLSDGYQVSSGTVLTSTTAPRAPIPCVRLHWDTDSTHTLDRSHDWAIDGRVLAIRVLADDVYMPPAASAEVHLDGVLVGVVSPITTAGQWVRLAREWKGTSTIRLIVRGAEGASGKAIVYFWR